MVFEGVGTYIHSLHREYLILPSWVLSNWYMQIKRLHCTFINVSTILTPSFSGLSSLLNSKSKYSLQAAPGIYKLPVLSSNHTCKRTWKCSIALWIHQQVPQQATCLKVHKRKHKIKYKNTFWYNLIVISVFRRALPVN